jgi:hypothetical protein
MSFCILSSGVGRAVNEPPRPTYDHLHATDRGTCHHHMERAIGLIVYFVRHANEGSLGPVKQSSDDEGRSHRAVKAARLAMLRELLMADRSCSAD